MAATTTQGLPTCIVLIHGLPASGKTLLTTSLLECSIDEADMKSRNWIVVHFDDFYPSDTRPEEDYQDRKTKGEQLFVLKEARHRVNDCLEHFVSMNHLGSNIHSDDEEEEAPQTGQPLHWDTFIQCVNKRQRVPVLSDSGRLRQECKKHTVLLLDDNMPLRSIRHEYYQLARKYQMGFVEVCVQCSLKVAVERNSQRPTPITHSTLETMEQTMEVPDPARHHWEERSTIIVNESNKDDFIKAGIKSILPLVEEGLSNPVLSIAEEDITMKEECRAANVQSYIHQVDMILRNSVSQLLTQETLSKENRAGLAKKVNAVRRRILSEAREGNRLGSRPLAHGQVGHPTSEQFRKLVDDMFREGCRQS